mgnify:CR=1 FL=1
MPQYWSLTKLHETAKALYQAAAEKEGTQKAVIENVNHNRESMGLDAVTRQAVQKAVREGGRSNVRLLCDIVDALYPQMQAVTRDEGDPVLHVEVADPQQEE